MRKMEYKIVARIEADATDSSVVSRVVDQIKAAGGTAEITTVKPVRVKKDKAAAAAASTSAE